MTGLAHFPSPADDERRRFDRIRLQRVVRAMIARQDAVLIDLSLEGARFHHERALRRGVSARVAFRWERELFAASAEVLACRIVTLGGNDGAPPIFETRVRFTAVTSHQTDLLARVIAALGSEELRTWFDNLHGSSEMPPARHQAGASGFIRCRYINRRWEKKWTRDGTQTSDGFTLPANTDPRDVDALCRTWETMNDEARELVRLTANAVAEQVAG